MKTLVYLFVIAMLLFAGCAKDEIFNDDMNLKSAPVKMVPLKANFHSESKTVDIYGLPATGILVGNFSHLGKLISEESTWIATSTGIVFNTDPDPEAFPYLSCTSYVKGQLAAANGDLLFYYFDSNLDFVKNEFTSQVIYTGGTGRFENCTGEAALTGYFDFNTGFIYGKVDGMITNVGSSK